jgi:hypothetical protein
VRARAGYVLGRPDALPALPVSRTPEGLKIARHTSPLIRAWFGQSAGNEGRTHVEFVWEPAPRVPGERGLPPAAARVTLSVMTIDGAAVFSGTVGAAGRELTGGPQTLQFESAVGPLLAQMEIQDVAGRVIDHDVRDLVIGGFPGPVTFGTAAVFRTRTMRELREVTAGEPVAPVASRQFSRTEHLVVRVPVVSRSGEPTVTVKLGSALGGSMRELPVTVDDGRVAQVDLALAALASGAYTLEFSARTPGGSALDRITFSVTP